MLKYLQLILTLVLAGLGAWATSGEQMTSQRYSCDAFGLHVEFDVPEGGELIDHCAKRQGETLERWSVLAVVNFEPCFSFFCSAPYAAQIDVSVRRLEPPFEIGGNREFADYLKSQSPHTLPDWMARKEWGTMDAPSGRWTALRNVAKRGKSGGNRLFLLPASPSVALAIGGTDLPETGWRKSKAAQQNQILDALVKSVVVTAVK